MLQEKTSRPVPHGDYLLDFFRPEDADGIADLFRTVYGDAYPVRTYYDPEALCRENRIANLISVVARNSGDRVVAHMGLYRSSPNPSLYETGVGLVYPEHRKAGLFSGLLSLLYGHAPRRFSMDGIWGQGVSNHTYTQQACLRQGAVPCALEVDLMPSETYRQEKSARGRVASVTAFRNIRNLPSMDLYVPDNLLSSAAFFYDGLDLERRFAPSPSEPDPRWETVLKTQYFGSAQVVRITVEQAGSCLAARVREIRARYDGSAAVYQCWVDLSHPGAAPAVSALRGLGFSLGGIVPLWNGGDGLLLQYPVRPPDWESIRVVGPKAGKMLDLVREDWRAAAEAAQGRTSPMASGAGESPPR